MPLTDQRRAAASGAADSLVIFLHGYGADGADLLGLADVLKEYLPNTVFRAPNAPEKCLNNPFGFQWFPIPHMDGSAEETARQSQKSAATQLETYILDAMKDENIPAARTILVGFSQGTMMSLHVGPRLRQKLAGIVGFSGRLLDPELLETEKVNTPPVLLVHGDSDPVVPPESLPIAANALTKAGFEVYTHMSERTEHNIAQDGLALSLQFIRQQLNLD